jgi:hypothetical protein
MMPSTDSAMIALRRERRGSRDLFRAYTVIVDDTRVAKVKRGQTVRLPVSPGRHEVYLRIDWCRSPAIEIDVAPGEAVNMYCAPAGSAFELKDAFANAGQYIALQVVERF